jgi:hypothetical protein
MAFSYESQVRASLAGSLRPCERREQDEHHRYRGRDANDVENQLNEWSSI